MNYKDIFTAAFSEVAPRKSEDAAAREIIEKGKAMKTAKTSTRKIFTSIAAAAAVLMIGGVTVGAATGWSFTDAFDKLFADRAQDASYENPIDYSSYVSPIDFSKMGKELDHSFEGDGYTLNVRGAAASDKTLFLLYDITFTEEFLTANNIDKEIISNPVSFIKLGESSSSTNFMYMNEGNTFSYCEMYHCHDSSLSGKTVEIEFRSIDAGNYGIISCDHEFDLKIDFAETDDVHTIELDETIQAGEDTVTLDKIAYDAFSVELIFNSITSSNHVMLWNTFLTGYITKTDGTQIALLSAGGLSDGNTGVGSFIADYTIPVLPEEIASITFGDYTIPLT